jgi:hypothetical protein
MDDTLLDASNLGRDKDIPMNGVDYLRLQRPVDGKSSFSFSVTSPDGQVVTTVVRVFPEAIRKDKSDQPPQQQDGRTGFAPLVRESIRRLLRRG